MTDYQRGYDAIAYYHSAMRALYASSFRYSLPEFIAILKRLPGAKALEEGLGLGTRTAGPDETPLSESQVRRAMDNLARRGGGKIPSKYLDFFFSLSNEAVKINFVDAAAFVTVESAKDVITGAQSVGDSLITSFKILNFLLPAIVILFVYFWLNKKSGGELGKVMGKAGRAAGKVMK